MRTVAFTVPGKPTGKARPRVTRNGTFMPQAAVSFAERVRGEWRALGAAGFRDQPVMVAVTVFRARPKSHYRASGELKPAALEMGPPITTPDLDNSSGAIMDSLNGYAWCDDRQVYMLVVNRRWSDADSVRVEITGRDAA